MIFNIEKRVYLLGEALVRAGDPPEGMYIITSGQCKAVLEGIGIKKVESGEFSRFQNQVKNFNCGKPSLNQQRRVLPSATEPSSPTADKKKALSMKERHDSFKNKEESLNRFNPDNSVFNALQGDAKKSF